MTGAGRTSRCTPGSARAGPRRPALAALASGPDRWEAHQVSGDEVRDGVTLTNLGQPLFEGAEATKRDLVEYLDAVGGRIIPVLRVLRGQAPFMQKNLPKYTPPWVPTVSLWVRPRGARSPTRCATTAGRCCG